MYIDVLLTNISVTVQYTVMTGQTSLLRVALTVPYQASLPVEMVSCVQINTVTICSCFVIGKRSFFLLGRRRGGALLFRPRKETVQTIDLIWHILLP